MTFFQLAFYNRSFVKLALYCTFHCVEMYTKSVYGPAIPVHAWYKTNRPKYHFKQSSGMNTLSVDTTPGINVFP